MQLAVHKKKNNRAKNHFFVNTNDKQESPLFVREKRPCEYLDEYNNNSSSTDNNRCSLMECHQGIYSVSLISSFRFIHVLVSSLSTSDLDIYQANIGILGEQLHVTSETVHQLPTVLGIVLVVPRKKFRNRALHQQLCTNAKSCTFASLVTRSPSFPTQCAKI